MSEYNDIEELAKGMVTGLDGSIRKELEVSIERILAGDAADPVELDTHRRMLWQLQSQRTSPESHDRCSRLSARVDERLKADGVPFEGSFPVFSSDGSEAGVDPKSVIAGSPLPVGDPGVVLGSPDTHTAAIFDELVRTIQIFLNMPTDVTWQLAEYMRLLGTLVGDNDDRERRNFVLGKHVDSVALHWHEERMESEDRAAKAGVAGLTVPDGFDALLERIEKLEGVIEVMGIASRQAAELATKTNQLTGDPEDHRDTLGQARLLLTGLLTGLTTEQLTAAESDGCALADGVKHDGSLGWVSVFTSHDMNVSITVTEAGITTMSYGHHDPAARDAAAEYLGRLLLAYSGRRRQLVKWAAEPVVGDGS